MWNGGQDDFRAKDYARAERRLGEFTDHYPNHPVRDQALMTLHLAQKFKEDHEDALKTLIVLVERYPDSRMTRAALLSGANYALDQGREDVARRFNEQYLRKPESPQEAATVRESLIELYLATGDRSGAAQMLTTALSAGNLREDKIVSLGRLHVTIEDSLGGSAAAIRAAELLKRAAPHNSVAKALFYLHNIRLNFANRTLSQLVELERLIDGEADRSRDMSLALAEARFDIGALTARALIQDVETQGKQNPVEQMPRLYETFNELRLVFTNTCTAARSRFCAEGSYELFKAGIAFTNLYEAIELPEGTFDPKAVQNYRAMRTQILGEIAHVRGEALKQVRLEVTRGNADPTWIRTVYVADRDANKTPWLQPEAPHLFIQGNTRAPAAPAPNGKPDTNAAEPIAH